MRILAIALSCTLCTTLASAQTPAAPVVLDEITLDLDGNGTPETIRLLEAADQRADLDIDAPGGARLTVRGLLFSGGPGQQAQLEAAPNGSLRVMSMNEAIGRHRWRETLTVVYRDGAFRIGGYTYSWYDTISNEDGQCDINLLTGRGELSRNGAAQAVEVARGAPALADWGEDSAPAVCHAP